MAEAASENPPSVDRNDDTAEPQDMELVEAGSAADHRDSEALAGEGQPNGAEKPEENGGKRGREAGADGEEEGEGNTKKPKVDRSVEEERLEKLEDIDGGGGDPKAKQAVVVEEEEKKEEPISVSLGPKVFGSAVEMFDYFYGFLHYWPPNIGINKYEHMVLLDLLKKGHAEADRKIGEGIQSFQVRYHPMWKSRCFFLTRIDGSTDDFSFRKCVDRILPLPDNMKVQSTADKKLGSGHQKGGSAGGRGGRGGRGHGRRGGFRK